jgi:ribosome-associated protein
MIPATMAKKRPEGYWVRGQFVVRGSELDRELNDSDTLSKTDLKKQSADLQELGENLLSLRGDLYAKLDLPEKLRDAVTEAKRITSFEGKRRQMQYIGKLMRQIDPEPIRSAVQAQSHGTVAEKLALHHAEHWRDQLISADEHVTRFLTEFPGADVQHLRALVRQARKDLGKAAGVSSEVPADASPSPAPKSTRAYREIFQLVKNTLSPDTTNTPDVIETQHHD